jgi:HEAT repeat protein
LADGDYSTGWVEGAAGWGLGEFVTADVSEAYPLRGVRLFPGALSGAKEYAAYGVPTRVLLSFSDGTDLVAELPVEPRDAILEGGGFWVAFPKPVQTRCLTLTLLEVQPSKSSRDPRAALSEVAPLTDLDWADRQTALRRLVQDLATEPSRPRQAALSRLASNLGPELGATIVAEIEREFSTEGGRPDLERLLPLLALAPLSDTRVILARVLSWPDLNQRELSSLQRALTFRGQGYWDVLRDLALAESPSPHLRARAARLFGRAAPKARLADLLPLLGKGDDELRQATVQALGRGELGISDDLVREAAAAPNSPRCHDALWALDRVLRFHARGKPFELEGGERLFQIYNESEDIQIRLRAISLLDRVTVTSADTFLITVLESQERPEVRALAARALRRHPGPKSAEALGRMLKDPSPTLRFEALDALEPQVNLPTVIADLTAYARREGWRQGLVKAYGLLARSEQREGADYLYDIIGGGDEQRAEFALAALRDARNNVRALPLIRVVDDAARSERQRLLALEALSASPDPDAERVLVEAMRGRADLPPEARTKAARALGSRRTPGALAALRQQVQDPADPAVQRACIRALSNFRSRDALAALVALRGKLDPRSTRVLEDAIAALQERLDN